MLQEIEVQNMPSVPLKLTEVHNPSYDAGTVSYISYITMYIVTLSVYSYTVRKFLVTAIFYKVIQ